MNKWVVSLVLVGALSGGLSAGAPMQSRMNLDMMDCCKAALAQNDSRAASAARLCCTLNCQEPGTSGASPIQPGSLFTTIVVAPLAHVVPRNSNSTFQIQSAVPRTVNLQPTYILNLALLI
ncbi:MAG: hypothetical protein ABJB97_02795 [Acidobacteriota bacterium]